MTAGRGLPGARSPLDVRLGDVVRLRKPHPCGSYEWEVVRLGADIGLRCCRCQRRVLLARTILERRIKVWVERGPATDTSIDTGADQRLQ